MGKKEEVSAGEARKRKRCHDFSFAFADPAFSDCTIRLFDIDESSESKDDGACCNTSNEAEKMGQVASCCCCLIPRDIVTRGDVSPVEEMPCDTPKAAGKVPIAELPASSVILSMQSQYFRTLFTSKFLETLGEKVVDIPVRNKDADTFRIMISFLYTSSIPDEVTNSTANLARLMYLADRFDVMSCIEACMHVLNSSTSFSLEDTLLLLELPDNLQRMPKFKKVYRLMRKALRDEVGPLLQGSPSDDRFLKLSPSAICMLLEDDLLKVATEDNVVMSARSWVTSNSANAEEMLLMYGKILWPRIRFSHVSPEVVLRLLDDLIDFQKRKYEHAPDSDTQSEGLTAMVAVLRKQLSEGRGPEKFYVERLPLLPLISSSHASLGASFLVQHGYMAGTAFSLPAQSAPRAGFVPRSSILSLTIALDEVEAHQNAVEPSTVTWTSNTQPLGSNRSIKMTAILKKKKFLVELVSPAPPAESPSSDKLEVFFTLTTAVLAQSKVYNGNWGPARKKLVFEEEWTSVWKEIMERKDSLFVNRQLTVFAHIWVPCS